MKRTVLKFGLISGAISSVLMLASANFIRSGNYQRAEIFGYTSMVLAMLVIFFGVRSYRENAGGGRMTFGRGLAVGVLITLVTAVCYVATWEILYWGIMPDLGEKMAFCMAEKAKADGASQAELDKLASFAAMYANPLVNVAFTFLEPLPIGVVVSLLSALILRKKSPAMT